MKTRLFDSNCTELQKHFTNNNVLRLNAGDDWLPFFEEPGSEIGVVIPYWCNYFGDQNEVLVRGMQTESEMARLAVTLREIGVSIEEAIPIVQRVTLLDNKKYLSNEEKDMHHENAVAHLERKYYWQTISKRDDFPVTVLLEALRWKHNQLWDTTFAEVIEKDHQGCIKLFKEYCAHMVTHHQESTEWAARWIGLELSTLTIEVFMPLYHNWQNWVHTIPFEEFVTKNTINGVYPEGTVHCYSEANVRAYWQLPYKAVKKTEYRYELQLLSDK